MKIQDTLTRSLQELQPLQDNEIKLYTCGLTVYSQPHIGNWVAYIYWDVLVRTLRGNGYNVTRVQNITDVGHLTSDEDAGEDKMLKGALKEGLTAWQVAEKYMAIADDEAYNQLRLLRPDHMPRATDYIPQQISFVAELEEKGYTYIIDDGVYFDTSKLDNYGELARLDLEGLQFGARVEDTGKKNPTDFAVWKFSSPNEKRDMEWWSPFKNPIIESDEKHPSGWSRAMDADAVQEVNEQQAELIHGSWGFPGWHLECSVMAREILGDQIDIHTGGIDHIPVHHTNEIAQSEAVTGQQFSHYWMHANHIKVNGEKMSKSLGNIYTLKDITGKGFDLQAFKVMVLSKHYATEGNFTWEILESAQNRLHKWREAAATRWQEDSMPKASTDYSANEFHEAFSAALGDNLNTGKALQLIDEFSEQANDGAVCGGCMDTILQEIESSLGIDLFVQDMTSGQQELLSQRQAARDNKDWATSDQLRDELLQQGIGVKDTPTGQIWFRP